MAEEELPSGLTATQYNVRVLDSMPRVSLNQHGRSSHSYGHSLTGQLPQKCQVCAPCHSVHERRQDHAQRAGAMVACQLQARPSPHAGLNCPFQALRQRLSVGVRHEQAEAQ